MRNNVFDLYQTLNRTSSRILLKIERKIGQIEVGYIYRERERERERVCEFTRLRPRERNQARKRNTQIRVFSFFKYIFLNSNYQKTVPTFLIWYY